MKRICEADRFGDLFQQGARLLKTRGNKIHPAAQQILVKALVVVGSTLLITEERDILGALQRCVCARDLQRKTFQQLRAHFHIATPRI